MPDDQQFDLKKKLQENYLVIALSLVSAGAVGTITSVAALNSLLESKFEEYRIRKNLISSSELNLLRTSKDAIGLFLTACPDSWRDFPQAAGRYVVIARGDQPGLLGTQVGVPLEGAENRPAGAHLHGFKADEHLNQQGQVPMEFRSPGGGHMPVIDRQTDSGTGLKPGTNAPYIFVNACLKN